MKRHLFTAIILFLSCCNVFGQISTDEEPVSYRMNIPALQRSAKAQKTLPALDMQTLEQEDIEDGENGIPPRFGYKHEVNYTLDNSGEWTVLPGGDRIWRLTISCPDALSINLLYDKFWLPNGAKFFIYSSDHKHTIGAFTSVNNNGDGKDIQGFATGLVYGDQVTLEYYLPNHVKETGVISVAYVVHGYRFIYLSNNETRDYGDSEGCHININCTQGQGWQNEKNAIAMILVNGDRACTGSLINTTANDNSPLFLTADHCLYGADAINSPNLAHWSFYWHYESPGCTNAQPAAIRSTSGAKLVANNSISDFALLRLTEDPRNKTGVTPYYLGWDRSGNPGTGGVGIHHPKGDIKKISLTNQIQNHPSIICWGINCSQGTSPANTHWNVLFYNGTTEGGSSGSPLINNNRKVIGQLHGGKDGCAPITKYYGKFSVSWTGNGATDNRRKLQPWLDPYGTIPTTIDGIPEIVTPTISGSSMIGGTTSATYTVTNKPAGATLTWYYDTYLLTQVSSSANGIVLKPKTATTVGDATVRATLNYPGGVQRSANRYVGVSGPHYMNVQLVVTASSDGSEAYPDGGLCPNSYYYANLNAGATLTNVNWGASSHLNVISSSNTQLYFGTNSAGYGTLNITATVPIYGIPKNILGVTLMGGGCSKSSSYSKVLSVPSASQIEVEFDMDTYEQQINTQVYPATPAFDIRLFSIAGILVKQATSSGETVQLDVSGLPNGTYVIHIYDGISPTPEVHKVQVAN